MSAHSTGISVILTPPTLFASAENPWVMAQVPVEEGRDIMRWVALSPQNSKSIVNVSQLLVEKYEGEVPADMELLE